MYYDAWSDSSKYYKLEILREENKDLKRQIEGQQKRFDMLMAHLGLKIVGGPRIVKIQADKKVG